VTVRRCQDKSETSTMKNVHFHTLLFIKITFSVHRHSVLFIYNIIQCSSLFISVHQRASTFNRIQNSTFFNHSFFILSIHLLEKQTQSDWLESTESLHVIEWKCVSVSVMLQQNVNLSVSPQKKFIICVSHRCILYVFKHNISKLLSYHIISHF